MVNGFLEKMGVDIDVEKIAENYGGKNPWAFANGDRCGGHKLKRAQIVAKPQDVLEATLGQTLFVKIQIKNATHWPWKQGCFLGMDESVELVNMPIEFVNVPVDFEVKGQATFEMTVPITILPNAVIAD
jgi:hypothetical protein